MTDNDTTAVTGKDNIEGLRWITVRSALRLEIRSGLKRSSRGRPTIVLANEIMGTNFRSKRDAYVALNNKIVEECGSKFDMPLEEKS